MHTTTASPEAPHYGEPQDPWEEGGQTMLHPTIQPARPLTEAERAHFSAVVANYYDTSADDTLVQHRIYGEPLEQGLATPEERAEVERRAQQALLATFTLANTLQRNGQPERLQELQRVTTPPVGHAAVLPPRPDRYEGRHRRRRWWQRGSK